MSSWLDWGHEKVDPYMGFLTFMYYLIEWVIILAVLAVILIVIVKILPKSRLKTVMKAIRNRVTLTALVGLVGIPIQPVAGVDEAYDIGGVLLLGFYWYTMIRKLWRVKTPVEPTAPPPTKQSGTLSQFIAHVKTFKPESK